MANGNLERTSLGLAPEDEAAGLRRMVSGKLDKASLVGGALAAIVASVCCLGPLVLVSVGISGAWISNLTAFEPYRAYAIGVALLCVALAFRKIYGASAQ